jgi:hypothetical protein
MTTDERHTDHETIDASDLLDSMQITQIKRRSLSSGGAWVTGTIGDYRFDALVFPEHAENDAYELDNSRISKLWIATKDRATVFNWDRGADVPAATPMVAKIVGLLAAGLAETVFGR